jgi:hypothetical protein
MRAAILLLHLAAVVTVPVASGTHNFNSSDNGDVSKCITRTCCLCFLLLWQWFEVSKLGDLGTTMCVCTTKFRSATARRQLRRYVFSYISCRQREEFFLLLEGNARGFDSRIARGGGLVL